MYLYMAMLKTRFSKKQLLEAGIVLVIILLLTGVYLKNDIWLKISLGLLFIDIIFPPAFYPFAWIWFNLSDILGTVVSKIILSVIFFIIVLPVGIIRKILGKDSLLLKKFRKDQGSVMKIRNYTYQSADFDKPF